MDEILKAVAEQSLNSYLLNSGISLTETQRRLVLKIAKSRIKSGVNETVIEAVSLAKNPQPDYQISVTADELRCLRFDNPSLRKPVTRYMPWLQKLLSGLGIFRIS